ncbi:MAG TPA: hypothetical protein VM328_03955, partial [Fimbriimonadaceae bacterium]|nr:hypothetical protein [Fimbriimonadaceae bacterium]
GAISIVQALKVAPRILLGARKVKRALATIEPGLFIPIDFGYANIRLARHAKKHGWKVLYFIPPGSWRRDRQGKDLPEVTDEIVTPFPWSAEMLQSMGASAHFFGHPIKQMMRQPEGPVERIQNRIAVLSGSRRHEIKENLPVVARALRGEEVAEFAVAPSTDLAWLQGLWARLAPHRSADLFTRADVAGVLRRSQAAIVCSGTATLEAALCRCPMVVIYRLTKLMEFEARLLKTRPRFVSLPNIVLEREVVPELIQADASPSNVRRELDLLLEDGPSRAAQLKSFEELDALLGPADAIARAAQLALSLLLEGQKTDVRGT